MVYYLAIDGAKSGALTCLQVRERIEGGEAKKSTLAWIQGMDAWCPLGEFAEFKEDFDPPGCPTVSGRDRSEVERAAREGKPTTERQGGADNPRFAPWIRLFARGVDIILLLLVFDLVFTFLAPGLGEVISASLTRQIIAHSAMILTWCFVEALFLSVWGYTPGKALFRIRVRDGDGEILSYKTALQRAVLVWVKGLALMFVWITPVAMMIAHARLMVFGTTTWDRDLRLRVTHGRPTQAQIIVAVVIYAAFAFLVFQAIQFHLEEAKREDSNEGEGRPGDGGKEERREIPPTYPEDIT